MSSDIIALVIAIVGVCGTLASAVITQQSANRARTRELEHAEHLRLNERRVAEEQRRTDQLRGCCVRLNANDRNYRDAMLAHAHALKAGIPGEETAAEVAAARRAQRDARAEAQLVIGEETLEAEGRVNAHLAVAFGQLKRIEHEDDASLRGPLLDEVIKLLDDITPMLCRVRAIMRMDLGIADRRDYQ